MPSSDAALSGRWACVISSLNSSTGSFAAKTDDGSIMTLRECQRGDRWGGGLVGQGNPSFGLQGEPDINSRGSPPTSDGRSTAGEGLDGKQGENKKNHPR